MDWGVGLLAFLSLGLGGPFLPLVYHASINLFNRVYMLIKYPDLYIWTAAATGWEGESWKDRWFLGLAFGVSRTVFGYLQLQSCSRHGCIYIYFLPPSLAITLKGVYPTKSQFTCLILTSAWRSWSSRDTIWSPRYFKWTYVLTSGTVKSSAI